jgi:hypothetical protein
VREETVPAVAEFPFTDPVTGRECVLCIPPGGRVYPLPGQPKTGVRHPGCDHLADLSVSLDAFWCRACLWNGRVSGAWAIEMIRKVRQSGPGLVDRLGAGEDGR